MNNLQHKKSNIESKQDEIIEYLKQNDGYWLKNDKWDLKKEFFIGEHVYNSRFLDFTNFRSIKIKNEVKFYLIYNFKNKYNKGSVIEALNPALQKLALFTHNYDSFLEFKEEKSVSRWMIFLRNNGINGGKSNTRYYGLFSWVSNFIIEFYDDREETEKNIWYSKNIRGAKIPASGSSHSTYNSINFTYIPTYYRNEVKRYFKTIITKKSWSSCKNTLQYLNYFFNYFYSNEYENGFIENLNRSDIEKFLYHIGNDREGKNATQNSKYVSFVRTFLEYTQMAQYDKAPKKEVSFLIFQDDIPRREFAQDQIRRVKFVPAPILEQFDNNIMELDRPQYIPIYILLRETEASSSANLLTRVTGTCKKV